MDFQEIWEENKRWILGVAIGFVLYLIGGAILGTMYETDTGALNRIRRTVKGNEYYTTAARDTAITESEQIGEVATRLEDALVFRPAERFDLTGKGDPFLHFSTVQQSVSDDLLDRADALGVDLRAQDLKFTPPTNRAEIADTLIGFAVMHDAAQRLYAAHEKVRSASDEALGLVGIDSFKIASTRRTSRGGRRSRGAFADRLQEQRVSFTIRTDEATLRDWLERCAGDTPRISLEADFKATTGRTPGDPLLVTGTLSAVRVVEEASAQ